MSVRKIWVNPEIVDVDPNENEILFGDQIAHDNSGVILQSINPGGITYMTNGDVIKYDVAGNLIEK